MCALIVGGLGALASQSHELPGVAVSDNELHEMKAAATIKGYCAGTTRCSVNLGYCNPFSCGSGAAYCGYAEGQYNKVCYPYATAYSCVTDLPAVTPCVNMNSVCLSYYYGCYCSGTGPMPIGYGSYTVC